MIANFCRTHQAGKHTRQIVVSETDLRFEAASGSILATEDMAAGGELIDDVAVSSGGKVERAVEVVAVFLFPFTDFLSSGSRDRPPQRVLPFGARTWAYNRCRALGERPGIRVYGWNGWQRRGGRAKSHPSPNGRELELRQGGFRCIHHYFQLRKSK